MTSARLATLVVALAITASVSACVDAPAAPGRAPGPSSSTTPLGPRSTVTVEVTGATPPTVDVATLSLRGGDPTFGEFRTVPTPARERFAFGPPPGADGMGVVVRMPFGVDASRSVDCTITVDGLVVEQEEQVHGCSYSNDPRWTYGLDKGVIPGRYWPPGR